MNLLSLSLIHAQHHHMSQMSRCLLLEVFLTQDTMTFLQAVTDFNKCTYKSSNSVSQNILTKTFLNSVYPSTLAELFCSGSSKTFISGSFFKEEEQFKACSSTYNYQVNNAFAKFTWWNSRRTTKGGFYAQIGFNMS